MSEFRRVYPSKESILFDGGLNNKFERSIIEDNESPSCANVVFNNGSVETRQGVTKLNTGSVGSFVGDGLYVRRANDNAETMVAAWNGSIYAYNAASFVTIPSSQSLFTGGVRFGAAMAENYLYLGNGGQIPYKWNGAEFTRHGVYPPTTTATVASAATGAALASGSSYIYKFTYVNSNLVESDVGPAVTHVVTANSMGNVALTAIPVAPVSFGVNARRIYRTVAGGTAFKRVTTIANNTATTYDDAITDANLGTAAPTDNGVPPKWNVIVYHQGRLFMNDTANPNYVWYTELDTPYTVASTNFERVGDNTSDLVKGLAVHNDVLFIFCEKSVTMIYMPDTTAANWKRLVSRSAYGCKSPYALIKYDNKVLFPAVQNGKIAGFAAMEGDAVAPSSSLLTISTAGSEMQSERIEPDIFNIQEAYLQNISGIVYKNKAYLSCTYGSSQTANNRYYTYDFSLSNLKKHQKTSWVPNTGLAPAQFAIYGGFLYFQTASATGYVYKMDAGVYSDDGAAIDSYLWTKEFSGYEDDTNIQKDFRYANILIENSGAWFMNLTYRVNSDLGGGDTQQISLNPGGSLWGTMMWGRDLWGGGTQEKEFRQFLGSSRGKRIQFKFSNQNTAGQKFKVLRMNFAYNLKGYR